MAQKSRPEFIPIWERALTEEFGLRIEVSGEPVLVTNDLYATRAEMGNPELENLRICQMANGELWIVRKEVELKEVEIHNAPPPLT